ncbi:MAG: hypothetical protein M0P12_00180 [Paludibacteraceae bacterium]|jgi:hypothetical protein|nr:hypothetical protein [Paludibacteraceae bacterium]MCK9615572.1 hypothetical protein [Candidatus Omnitrophota bacterium]
MNEGLKNPIYVEYYSHLGEDCYKIDIPWINYHKYTLVLCPVNEGIEKAKLVAEKAIKDALSLAFENPIEKK